MKLYKESTKMSFIEVKHLEESRNQEIERFMTLEKNYLEIVIWAKQYNQFMKEENEIGDYQRKKLSNHLVLCSMLHEKQTKKKFEWYSLSRTPYSKTIFEIILDLNECNDSGRKKMYRQIVTKNIESILDPMEKDPKEPIK